MTTPLDDLTKILVAHQRIRSTCLCGYEYRIGESILEHRAQMIIDAGWISPAQLQAATQTIATAIIAGVGSAFDTGRDLNDRVDAEYLAKHPDFRPSDLKVGERVTPADDRSVPTFVNGKYIPQDAIGTITDVREHGAVITVDWTPRTALHQHLNSGQVRRAN